MHHSGKFAGRLIGTEQRVGAAQLGVLDRVEGERQLHGMGCSEVTVKSAGAPGELISEGGGVCLRGVGTDQRPCPGTEQGVAQNGRAQLRG
jgi:hypothetical protein